MTPTTRPWTCLAPTTSSRRVGSAGSSGSSTAPPATPWSATVRAALHFATLPKTLEKLPRAEYDDDLPYGRLAANDLDDVPPNLTWRQLATPGDAPRPKNMYGVCKVVGETLGRYYSDQFGLSFIAIRLGGVNEPDRPNMRRQFPCAPKPPAPFLAAAFGKHVGSA